MKPDIGAIRERLGLKQQEAATMLGVTLRTQRNWECVRAPMPVRILWCLLNLHPHIAKELRRSNVAGVLRRGDNK